MPRVKGGIMTRKRHKKILKRAKGFKLSRNKQYRTAINAVKKALYYSYRDRKVRKREMRKLWITRINIACRKHGLSYSKFMGLLKKANININRKILADMAVRNAEDFASLIEEMKKQ